MQKQSDFMSNLTLLKAFHVYKADWKTTRVSCSWASSLREVLHSVTVVSRWDWTQRRLLRRVTCDIDCRTRWIF